MIPLPKEMNWKRFSDYVASRFDWFRETTDDAYPNMVDKNNPSTYTRADHIFSDIEVKNDNVVLLIQEGDLFSDGLETYLSSLNGLIRKKYDCFFTIKKVDHF